MSQSETSLEQLLPLELKLRILEGELDRLESDSRWLEKRKAEVIQDIDSCKKELLLRRTKADIKRIK
jgi:hypothetical protein